MLRKAALALIPIVLLATACGGGGSNKNTTKTATPRATATAVADGPAPGPTAIVIPTVGAPGSTSSVDGGGAASALFDTVNPFQLLGDLGGAPSSGNVDPALGNALLDEGDVPSDFMSLGNFTYSVPSQYGSVELAANMFAGGDLVSGDFGGMVMSAALSLPPEAIAEINAQGGLAQLADLTDADLREIEGFAGEFGVAFDDLRLLNASGLGEGGVGMHMVMDFGGLLDAFGAPEGDNPFSSGLAIDMYMFLRGDHMLMVMVMWPAGESSGVDSRDLAETLDANASAAF
jgi:hypothetical protein